MTMCYMMRGAGLHSCMHVSKSATVHLRFVRFIAYKFHIKIGKKKAVPNNWTLINGILLEVFSKKCTCLWASQVVLVGKNLPVNADVRDKGLIPELGRSPGGGHGNSLQYSCLENPMDRGAWQLQSMGSQSQTWLKQFSTHARTDV